MMNGTERIAEALQMRGIFLEVKDDFIHLTNENSKEDIAFVSQLLNDLNIPTFWRGNKFQVLVERIPVAIMKKIMNQAGREFLISMQGYHYKWKVFAQRRFGIKVNAFNLDANIAFLVRSLNLAGITALAGCNGHHRHDPNVQLSGVFQGAWFEVIQEKYLSECTLHYKWIVHYGNNTGSSIIAEKEDEARFNMNLIYQDAIQMASVLQKHAKEIRELKNHTFKRNKDMKKEAYTWIQDKNIDGLVAWMKRKLSETK